MAAIGPATPPERFVGAFWTALSARAAGAVDDAGLSGALGALASAIGAAGLPDPERARLVRMLSRAARSWEDEDALAGRESREAVARFVGAVSCQGRREA